MAKYLLLADGHFSNTLRPSEIESLQRLAIGIFGKNSNLAQKITNYYGQHHQRHLDSVFDQITESGPFDGLISLGDHYYDWDCLGLDTEDKINEAKSFKQDLLAKFAITDDRHIWVPGNHDLGFLNSSLSAGPSLPTEQNFSCYHDIYGPTFGLKQISEHFWNAWVSTAHMETFWAKPKINNRIKLDWLIKRQQEEMSFLDEELEKIDGQFFFGAHDPGSFLSAPVVKILDRHHHKLAGSFTGHLHADWLMKLAKIYRPKLKNAFAKYRVHFIPSIWGIIMPITFRSTGAGWNELEINGRESKVTRQMLKK